MKKTSPIVVHENDLYVEASSIMNPMIAIMDSLPIVIFEDRKTIYLPIDAAIDWCLEEMKFNPDSDRLELPVKVMRRAKEQFADGTMIIENETPKKRK